MTQLHLKTLKPLFMGVVFTAHVSAVYADDHKGDGLSYVSAFENYHYFTNPELDDWYQLNQTVDEIGGWRYYVQEPYRKPLNPNQMPANKGLHQHHHHHHHGGAK